MSDDSWHKVKETFHAALELPWEKRDEFLTQRCADDPALRAEVEHLLEHDIADSHGFLSPELPLAASPHGSTPAAGDMHEPLDRDAIEGFEILEETY